MRSASDSGGRRGWLRRRLAGLGVLAGTLASVAVASPVHAAPVTAPHVQVELLADTAALEPGRVVTVGVHFLPEQGWHVYWRNPGDSGEAPRVEWTLPPGLTAGALAWPAPTRLEVGPLVSFGFPGETLLTTPISVAPTIDSAAPLALAAHARWLVCNRDECIPGNALLSLSLPIGTATAAAPEIARLFAAARHELPQAAPATWRLAASTDPERVTLTMRGIAPPASAPFFFPYDRDAIQASAPQPLVVASDGFRLELARRSGAPLPATLAGVLRVGEDTYEVAAPVGPPAGASGGSALPITLAFAGGLLLNLMPCVFPVLALKALALAGLAGEARRRVRRHGLVYAAGIVVSFWILAGTLLIARAGGAELGWGFQLQSPVVIAILAGLFFWMALVLLDLSSIGGAIMGVGQHLTVGDGDRAAFFTGILATVVATPCTAPFMGTALGYALAQPAGMAFAVFTSLGLGLAFPYVLVTFVPALAARLPRPGPWMETLKQLLAFPLLATVVWLVWVASFQAGPSAVAAILAGLVMLAFAAWAMRRWQGAGGHLIAIAAAAAAVGLSLTITPLDRDIAATAGPVAAAAGLVWEPFSTTRIAELRAQGRPVFVDFTAAWCVTCQINKQVALETPQVAAKMQALGVTAIRADWTRPDAEITRALQEFGRDGVPLYVLYSGRDDPPRILPQILTPTIVITALEQLEAPALISGAKSEKEQHMSVIRTSILSAAVVAFCLAASVGHADAPKVGAPAPAFTTTDIHGKARQLSEFKGKYVVLEWHNQSCPFVKKHYDSANMQKLQKELTGKGAVWLTVISSAPGAQGFVTPEQETKYLAEKQASPTDVLLDPEGTVGKAYGAKTTPHMFVIDDKGVLIYAGAIDDNPSSDPADTATAKNYVRAAYDEASAGKPVTTSATAPYGCGVKYQN